MDTDKFRFDSITEQIIGAAFRVGNGLGAGFLEKVYENALAHELRKIGFHVLQQQPVKVWWDGQIVGEFVCDLLVNDTILVELKAIRSLDEIHSAQCINYLAATGLPVCLLINFSRKVEVKRIAGSSL